MPACLPPIPSLLTRIGLILLVAATFGCAAPRAPAPSLNDAINERWPHAAELDDFIRADAERRQIPGLSVAIVRGDRVQYARGYGSTRWKGGEPITPDTQFGIGSLTKTFTAALLLHLRDAGALSLSDVVWQRLPPEIAEIRQQHERPLPAVRVMDVLSHVSAFPRLPADVAGHDAIAPYKGYDCARLQRALCHTDFEGPPRERYAYSNFGYAALGLVIERAAGAPFSQALDERILEPLGLSMTYVGRTRPDDPRLATGHAWADPFREQERWNHGCLAPQGAMLSTSLDMARWLAFWIDGSGGALMRARSMAEAITPFYPLAAPPAGDATTPEGGGAALADAALADAPTRGRRPRLGRRLPARASVGYGWHLREYEDGHIIAEHAGLTGGFGAYMAYSPRARVGVVLLANRQSTMGPTGARIMDWLVELATARPVTQRPSPHLAER